VSLGRSIQPEITHYSQQTGKRWHTKSDA
jgi:hypothetical protein